MEALDRLSDLAVQRFSTSDEAVRAILNLIADVTGMPTTWVSRVENDQLSIVAAHDEPNGSGVSAGDRAPLTDTFCAGVLAGDHPKPLIINDVAKDLFLRQSVAAQSFNIQSYIGVPITLSDDTVYGTLCASDPNPGRINDMQTKSMTVLSRLLATQIERDREAEARARAEERYRLLAERGAGVLQVLDAHGVPEYVSPSVQRVLGVSPDEFVREYRLPGATLVHPDDQHRHDEAWVAALAGEESMIDARYHTRDRGYRWMGITFGPLTSPEGEWRGIRCGFRDIDEQRVALDRLRESERLFNAFMDNSPLVAYMKDEDHRYVYVNDVFQRAFNLDAQWLEGRTDADWLPADQAAKVMENDRQIVASGQPSEFVEVVDDRARPGSANRQYWYSMKFPFTDAKGRTFVGGLSANITERRKKDVENARMASIIENSQDAIYGRTLDGVITSWNPASARLFGFDASEMVGKPINRLVPSDLKAELAAITARVNAGERVDSVETRRLNRAGECLDVAISVSPIRDTDGQIIGSSTIARDITERQRLLQERQRLLDELREELSRAARIQAQLIPRQMPELPGFSFAAICQPAREVGGDFYDWTDLPGRPGQVRLSLGDVTGKGMSAALLMTTARSALRSVVDRPGDEAVTTVNRALSDDLERSDSFVTLFQVDLSTDGTMEYVDAGHGLALILRRDRTVDLPEKRGLPIGIDPDAIYSARVASLEPGDTLLIYSDGLPDARPELGLDDPAAIGEILRKEADPDAMLRRLVEITTTGAARPDDLTLIFVQREESAS
ncbi:MAG TPA: PAS domain-containing protein [Thermomicrobiales bacterium]|nr:PAS domain-containing protein [Thermomicrobiales bacterium]